MMQQRPRRAGGALQLWLVLSLALLVFVSVAITTGLLFARTRGGGPGVGPVAALRSSDDFVRSRADVSARLARGAAQRPCPRRVWVVMTSVDAPGPTATRWCSLAQRNGWGAVVIGDQPREGGVDVWQGRVPSGCEYLDPDAQLSLPFLTAEAGVLPWHAYARKNLGYLYALWGDAEVVIDADDDNDPDSEHRGSLEAAVREMLAGRLPGARALAVPSQRSGLSLRRAPQSQLHSIDLGSGAESLASHSARRPPVLNPYPLFGLGGAWPRGMPLSLVEQGGQVVDCATAPVGRLALRPLVLQLLADGDPDVDAIWRLGNGARVGRARFHTDSPPILAAPGTYVPLNSQATLWHRDALVGAFLPTTVPGRVTDIVRGYIAQRFLWWHQHDNGVAGIWGAAVHHARHPHSIQRDLLQEISLYRDAEELLNALDEWTPRDSTQHADTAFIALIAQLVTKGLLQPREESVAAAFAVDIAAMQGTTPSDTRCAQHSQPPPPTTAADTADLPAGGRPYWPGLILSDQCAQDQCRTPSWLALTGAACCCAL